MLKSSPIITKSPGKVLISGGYGVLQQNNYGLVLAVDSYFYCTCTQYVPCQETNYFTDVWVSSFQIGQLYRYRFDGERNTLKEVDDKVNVFVENAIFWTLIYFRNIQKAGKIKLAILFTRNFLSNNDAIDKQKQFPIYKKIKNKTGLGSSACVIVSIVKCLTKLFITHTSYQQQIYYDINKLVNVISQAANLSAQKKIGSNFDISTAVFGTHLYKNILPHKISKFINLQHNSSKFEMLTSLVKIDPEITKIGQPTYQYYSYIIDVNKGSDTRIMVKNFISQLHKCSQDTIQQFYTTSKQLTLNLFKSLQSGMIQKCKQLNQNHRKFQHKYSQITKIQIQPKDLSSLLDQITNIQQVLYAICPGSGGYDAIFVISLSDITSQLIDTIGIHSLRQVQILFNPDFQLTSSEKDNILHIINTLSQKS